MSTRSPSGLQAVAPAVPAEASAQLRALMAKMLVYCVTREADNLVAIRSRLFDLLDEMPSHGRAQNLRFASVMLGKHAEVFHRAFQDALHASLEALAREALPQADQPQSRPFALNDDMDGLTLSLIDVQEVERILLVDRVAQRFSAHYDAVVSPLTQRLGVLLGLDSASLSNNPFRPEVFVRAFLLAWEKCDWDNQVTEDLLSALDPAHCMDLAPLYVELNTMLVSAGVQAQAAYRIKKSDGTVTGYGGLGPASAPAPPAQQEAGPNTGTPSVGLGALEPDGARSAWGVLAPVGRSMAAQARHFLQRIGFATFANPGDHGPVPAPLAPVDSEFMGYLGGLQAGSWASVQSSGFDESDLEQHNILRHLRSRDEVRRAPELDRGTVDALAEIFDYVFADQAIPLQMKFVIGRLQIPVLKAAMIDRDFFLSDAHPARRLVDTLACASVAWAPEKGEHDPLYVQIERTVQRVLTEFEDDIAVFSDLLREFTEFLFETEQQVQGRIAPVASHEQVGETYEQALAHVDEVIHARIRALPPELPLAPFLAPFLTTQWREVLARAWLGVESEPAQWESALAAMDQLIWSTQPKIKSEERRQLVAVLPELVRTLNGALDGIECHGEVRETFTRRLISTHMLAIRMTQPAALDSASAALDASEGQQAMSELDQRRADKRIGAVDAFDDMVQTFTRGLWFDFMEDPATQHRCLLSWVSPLRTRLLFTNREGFEAFVRSEREVAALLRRGLLKVVDQEPIVSRAIGRILSDAELELKQAA
ncbi:MAG: hypothetical protein A3F78_00415 [Burkholderiales bacterium RIFCSPLOWO2_12_FULL_61_40]|nr:MAG: hypothetical protein A3F78_00415 [Burkholderiales bacterium RIFCSPLOWO2_12_FULL_61_40]